MSDSFCFPALVQTAFLCFHGDQRLRKFKKKKHLHFRAFFDQKISFKESCAEKSPLHFLAFQRRFFRQERIRKRSQMRREDAHPVPAPPWHGANCDCHAIAKSEPDTQPELQVPLKHGTASHAKRFLHRMAAWPCAVQRILVQRSKDRERPALRRIISAYNPV